MAGKGRRNVAIAATLLSVAGGMVGLAYASVPLYRLFCQVTGFGGTPRTEAASAPTRIDDRVVTVRFDANVNAGLPWNFRPEQREVKVRAGETALAYFLARNDAHEEVVGHATFNVTPFKAGPYFVKVQCFCFTEQRLAPGQEERMPVSFFVDPAMFDDPDARDVSAITLSYTFFRAPEEGGGNARTAGRGGETEKDGASRRPARRLVAAPKSSIGMERN